jgi:hypothetical protein
MAETAARRLEIALDLADLAVELVEQKIRRDQPELSDSEVARRVTQWCRSRPGAEAGDAEGRAVCWPRPTPVAR